jgi:hypothetical protein
VTSFIYNGDGDEETMKHCDCAIVRLPPQRTRPLRENRANSKRPSFVPNPRKEPD